MDSRKIFDYALKTFLFLSPIFFFRNYQLSFARGLFLILGSFALFGISLGLEPRRKLFNIWISLFLLLALLRVFFNNSLGDNMQEWFNFWLACAGFIYVFCGVLLFYTIYIHADNIEKYFIPIAWVCVANFILVIAQMFNYDFMWAQTSQFSRICGFFEINAQMGQYSAMSLPILFFIHPALIVFPLFTLIASKSVTPITALLVGLIFLGWHSKRKLLVKWLILIILVWGIFNVSYIKGKWHTRPIMWKKTLSAALKTPYLGAGYQSFNKQVIASNLDKMLGKEDFSRPHSDYLHTAQELGFPILITIAMFFIGLYKKFKVAVKDRLLLALSASVLIALVNMGGQAFIRYASVGSTFIVLLALFCTKLNDVTIIETEGK